MGGHLRIMISGSSSLDAKLSRLFCAAGIILNEGYGLTETSPIISTNIYPNRGLRIGSIGRPFENLDVRIADDGEILVKGPSANERIITRTRNARQQHLTRTGIS